MGQFLRNSLFLQAFYEGRDRGGIFGKSRLISSAYVLSMMCKTPESNKSPSRCHRVRDRRLRLTASPVAPAAAKWHSRDVLWPCADRCWLTTDRLDRPKSHAGSRASTSWPRQGRPSPTPAPLRRDIGRTAGTSVTH